MSCLECQGNPSYISQSPEGFPMACESCGGAEPHPITEQRLNQLEQQVEVLKKLLAMALRQVAYDPYADDILNLERLTKL